jgi:hypothetical protein
MSTAQIAAISADVMSDLDADRLGAMTTAQVTALTKPQLYGLGSSQWSNFSSSAQTALKTLWGSDDVSTMSGGTLS